MVKYNSEWYVVSMGEEFQRTEFSRRDLVYSFQDIDRTLRSNDTVGIIDVDSVEVLLIGSAYCAWIDDGYALKDVDFYIKDREDFEQLKILSNVRETSSDDVLHMSPYPEWKDSDVIYEWFYSLESSLNHENISVDKTLNEELRNYENANIFDGDVLKILSPSIKAYSLTKSGDYSEKHREHINMVRSAVADSGA